MSDVLVRPIDNSPPPAPETIKAPMHSRDEVMREVQKTGMPIDEAYLPKKADLSEVFDSDEQGIWRATRALKKAREAAQGGNPHVTTDGYDQKAPITERKYSRDKDTPLSLREASNDLNFSKKWEAAARLSAEHGIDPYIAGQMQNLPDPPAEVGLVDDRGQLREPLGNRRLTPEDEISAHQAAKEVGNFRELAELQRQQLLNQLELETTQREADAAKPAEPQPQPAQQQPDPVVQERAHLEAQRQHLARVAEMQRLSAGEQAAMHEMAQIQQWAASAPSEERGTYDLAARARYAELQQGVRNAAVLRYAHDTEVAAKRAAYAEAYGKQEDTKFQNWLNKEHPQYAKGTLRRELDEVAKKVVTPEIAASYKAGGEARSFMGQRLIAEAAMWRHAQDRARSLNERKAPLPPVQRPVVDRPRGASDLDRVQQLQGRLERAKGNESLKIATQLQQARRAAGLA